MYFTIFFHKNTQHGNTRLYKAFYAGSLTHISTTVQYLVRQHHFWLCTLPEFLLQDSTGSFNILFLQCVFQMIAMVVEMELRLFIEVIPIATIAELMYQTRKTAFDHTYNTRSSKSQLFSIKHSRLKLQKKAFSRVGVKIWIRYRKNSKRYQKIPLISKWKSLYFRY